MFEQMDYQTLQVYWWVIISVLAGILVALFFVQGGQSLIFSIGKNNNEKKLIANSLGRKWELGFTTLVMFGGALFAAFPLFYATSFGGAYFLWMAILFCYIVQAVSYEYRTKPNNFLGQKTYELFLFIHGTVGVILIGVAVGSFFTGSGFKLIDFNVVKWNTSLRGLEAIFSVTNLSLGIALAALARILGAQYFINNIDDSNIEQRSRDMIKRDVFIFLPFFLLFVGMILFKSGYHLNPDGEIVLVKWKYLLNLLQLHVFGLGLFLLGVIGVLFSIYSSIFRKKDSDIWFGTVGTFLVVVALFFIAGFNNTAYYPSSWDINSSLTIFNSSSSKFTLIVMSYVSIAIPFVIGYISYIWVKMNATKISQTELDSDFHTY